MQAPIRELSRLERPALERHSDEALQLVAAAHLGRVHGYAELGISVLEGERGRGLGGALLARAHLRARNWGVSALFMHCLTENGAMVRLARKRAWRSWPGRARPMPRSGCRLPTPARISARCSSSVWRCSTTPSNKEERG